MARKLIVPGIAAVLAGTATYAAMRQLRRKPDDSGGVPDGDERVELADLESFPASDPPPWTLGEDR